MDKLAIANHLVEQRNCETHGAFEAKGFNLIGRVMWTGCPECSREKNEADAKEREAQREKESREAWMRKLKMSGIPDRFHDRRISNFATESPEMGFARDAALEYAKNPDQVLEAGRSMIFCGKPGTGKTHLAAAIGLAWMSKGYVVAFTTAMGAIRSVRETWRRDSGRSEAEAIEAFAMPDLLILDEVGQQYGSDGEKVILFDLINARYERSRPMLVMSNLEVDGVREFLGERAFDRLREGGGKAVPFTWKSYRSRAGREDAAA
jgi:DNA replication protein DnaC